MDLLRAALEALIVSIFGNLRVITLSHIIQTSIHGNITVMVLQP